VLGGMLSSLAHVLLVTPVVFYWLRERELTRAEMRQGRAASMTPALDAKS
jgi:Cu(I)/Ag(I) efflux system membrane protein CusA/SilA